MYFCIQGGYFNVRYLFYRGLFTVFFFQNFNFSTSVYCISSSRQTESAGPNYDFQTALVRFEFQTNYEIVFFNSTAFRVRLH